METDALSRQSGNDSASIEMHSEHHYCIDTMDYRALFPLDREDEGGRADAADTVAPDGSDATYPFPPPSPATNATFGSGDPPSNQLGRTSITARPSSPDTRQTFAPL